MEFLIKLGYNLMGVSMSCSFRIFGNEKGFTDAEIRGLLKRIESKRREREIQRKGLNKVAILFKQSSFRPLKGQKKKAA